MCCKNIHRHRMKMMIFTAVAFSANWMELNARFLGSRECKYMLPFNPNPFKFGNTLKGYAVCVSPLKTCALWNLKSYLLLILYLTFTDQIDCFAWKWKYNTCICGVIKPKSVKMGNIDLQSNLKNNLASFLLLWQPLYCSYLGN